jgi:hypothetical protein
MLFQDEEGKEKEVPMVRKRKQPSASISQPSEGGPSIDEAKEDKAEAALKKNEEKKKKKKNEDPRPKANVREKSAAKRPKVHKALKTSSNSGEKPNSQDDAAKGDVVEKDQTVKAAGEKIDGPEDDPAPHSETLIEDQNATDAKKQDSTQKGDDAPNAEKEKDSLTEPEVEAKEVYFALFSNFNFLSYPLNLIDFFFVLTG